MIGVKVEIVRENLVTGSGDAIIRLAGLMELPESTNFRIDPLDEDQELGEQPGWPAGDLVPLSARVGDAGVELVVAREIADAPALVPGTPVVISVPAADVRQEIRWPNLAPVRAVRRGVVIVSAEKRRAEIAMRAEARRAELERLTLTRIAAEAAARGSQPAGEDVDEVAGESLARLSASRKAGIKVVAGTDSAVQAASVVPAGEPGGKAVASADDEADEVSHPVIDVVESGDEATEPDSAAAVAVHVQPADQWTNAAGTSFGVRVVEDDDEPPANEPEKSDVVRPDRSVPELSEPPPSLPANFVPPPLPLLQPLNTASVRADRNRVPAYEPPPLPVTQTPRFLTRVEQRQSDTRGLQVAFGLGFLVAAGLALLSTFAFKGEVASLLGVGSQRPAMEQAVATEWSSILGVDRGPVRGEPVAGVELGAALKEADQRLYGESGGDRETAKFWLRKSIAISLGDPRTVWALTQLGTLYAAPQSGAPDYGAARQLWELAAANGDPVASCFLASLHEHGLGTPKNSARALELFRTAKANGGCRDIDQSIARLSKEAP